MTDERALDTMDLYTYLDQGILGQPFFGVPLGRWLLLLTVTALISGVLIVATRFLARRFETFAERTENKIDDIVATLLRQTRWYFLVALGLYLSVLIVELPNVGTKNVGRVAFVLLLLQVVWWGNSLIKLYVRRYKEENLDEDAAAVTTMQAVGFLGRILLWALVIMLALQNFGIEITPLIAGLGVGGIAVALAVQNVLGDLFASLSIVLDKPFVVGDFLIIDDYLGTVERIGLKTTRLRSLSGEQIVVSNGDLLNSRIRNYKRMFERRIVFTVGVVYGTPADQLEAIPDMIREIVEAQEQTRFDRSHFKQYGDSALLYETVYYVLVPDYNVYMDIQQAINLAIYRRFEDEGIDFAYPTQTLHVKPVQAEIVQRSMPAGDGA